MNALSRLNPFVSSQNIPRCLSPPCCFVHSVRSSQPCSFVPNTFIYVPPLICWFSPINLLIPFEIYKMYCIYGSIHLILLRSHCRRLFIALPTCLSVPPPPHLYVPPDSSGCLSPLICPHYVHSIILPCSSVCSQVHLFEWLSLYYRAKN